MDENVLRLRPFEAGDARAVLSWFADERAFRKWCSDTYDTFPARAEQMVEKYAAMDNTVPLTAVDGQGIAGHLILREMGEGTVRFGYIVLDGNRRGKGYGKQMLRLAMEYADRILGAKKITLGVFENNGPAKGCYQAVGFRKTQTATRQVLGEDWGYLEMELVLHP